MGRCNERPSDEYSSGSQCFFLPFRDEIIAKYSSLYEGSGESSARRKAFSGRWGWYSGYLTLAERNNITIEEATAIPLHSAMTLLSYEVEKSELEEYELKQKT